MAKKKLTQEEIVHLSKLANLQLTEDEIEKFKSQFAETLDYVENLHELDTKDVLPTNHTTNLKDVFFEDGTECTRMFTQKEALQNAKNTKNGYVVVKRIME
jgi:aspartyl-tRNA(Asn)/glutamyl-tRNA(Gln) amidotransferase subunit C